MADVEFHKQEDLNDVPLEGDITVPGLKTEDDEISTLDEPVKDTILRDVRAVGVKFFHVLYPKQSKALLREWDLWGPLILCTFMAMMLQGDSGDVDSTSDGGPEFAEVFVIYWVGAVVVTMNNKLLGGNISFFQSVCVLGYCVSPLAISLIVSRLILLAPEQTTVLFVIRFILVVIAFAWSTFAIHGSQYKMVEEEPGKTLERTTNPRQATASTAFLSDSQPPGKKVLAVYPIFLFYFIISWLVISHTHS